MPDRPPSITELERLFPAQVHRLIRAVASLQPACAQSANAAELERQLRIAARWAGDRDWSWRLESLCWDVETVAAQRGRTGVERRGEPLRIYMHPRTRDPRRTRPRR